jgi:uncharacterized protein (TIGR02118 family)
MTYITQVGYRNDPDAKYDIDYYATKHCPMAERIWAKSGGLKSWSVTKYNNPGPDGQPSASPYAFIATFVWESEQAALKAMADPATAELKADVANFASNKNPSVFLFGTEVAKSVL